MSYVIKNSRGTLVAEIFDGQANGPDVTPGSNATSLNLIGRNYPNYGLIQNENFVKLLENFAQTTANPPSSPITGQLWYDITLNRLKVYNGTSFALVTGSAFTASTSAPSGAATGDQWWDTTNDQFKTYNGSAWVTIGPTYSKLNGVSGAVVDTNSGNSILKMFADGNLIAIFSWSPAFTFTAITGFTTSDGKLYPGLNLNTTNSGILNGTATNSQRLNNVVAANYARKDITETFAANISIGGSSAALTSAVAGTGELNIRNTIVNADLNLYVNVASTPVKALNIVGSTGEVRVSAAPLTTNGVATKGYVDTSLTSYATLNSPNLVGVPTAPTAAGTDNSTKIATTAFAQAAIQTNLSAATNVKWQGSAKYVSTNPPDGSGQIGDFWFQI